MQIKSEVVGKAFGTVMSGGESIKPRMARSLMAGSAQAGRRQLLLLLLPQPARPPCIAIDRGSLV